MRSTVDSISQELFEEAKRITVQYNDEQKAAAELKSLFYQLEKSLFRVKTIINKINTRING